MLVYIDVRGLQNQALANERGTLCVDAILRKDYHTKPGKIGLLLQNPPIFVTVVVSSLCSLPNKFFSSKTTKLQDAN